MMNKRDWFAEKLLGLYLGLIFFIIILIQKGCIKL